MPKFAANLTMLYNEVDFLDRNEPGTGEINYPFLFDFIDRLGYDGWIGCEYKPKTKTIDGLGWIKPYLHA
jgi:hydroxypyruvate isomerase